MVIASVIVAVLTLASLIAMVATGLYCESEFWCFFCGIFAVVMTYGYAFVMSCLGG